ncbi:MAG: sigma-70 family RNA polymerase sigma factor [bacterium]
MLDRLSRCYGSHLLAVGRRWCRDGEAARDAVQDALLAAGEHLGDFRGEGSVEGWLVRMVVRACQRMRRGQKNDPTLHAPYEELEIPAQRETPADAAARGEELAALGAALLTLAPLDRTLVLLADGEGWTAPELADRVQMSPGAVRTRLSRARRALRAAMAAHVEGAETTAEEKIAEP